MNTKGMNDEVVPLLVGFSVLRSGSDALPGHYDNYKKVWVIKDGRDVKPIIETHEDLAELATKTFAEPERDDVESNVFLESLTKTEARPERDDLPRQSLDEILHLVTKTRTQKERDD